MSANLIALTSTRRKRLASVDVGTNTLRYLVAEVDQDHCITEQTSGRKMTRLGEGIIDTGRLSDAAMDRSLTALSTFAEAIKKAAPDEMLAVATSAVREAQNGAEFVARVRAETGLELTVIDGGEEARLTAIGAASVLAGDRNNLLIVDIGGGSTEFVHMTGGEQVGAVSIPLGVVTATERHVKHDPPRQGELYDLDEDVRTHIDRVRKALGNLGAVRLVATAGTPTTLAAMDQEMAVYDPDRINNHVMTLGRVEELFDQIATVSIAKRSRMIGIDPGREELLVAGSAILLRILHDWQFGVVTVSDFGLREGVLIDLFERAGD